MRPTCDLFDDHADDVTTCSVQFRDFGARSHFFGPIRTVNCLRDNQLLRSLLDEPGNGSVLIVDGGGSTETALMGDIIAAKAARNDWAGCVIYGAVRDSKALAEIDLGIKALGVNPAKSAKEGIGTLDEAVEFGGATFTPGAWVYCDEDGVLVAPGPLS